MTYEPIFIDGEQYFLTESGYLINVSELRRIFRAVAEQVEPGMSQEQINQIVSATVKRMSPN